MSYAATISVGVSAPGMETMPSWFVRRMTAMSTFGEMTRHAPASYAASTSATFTAVPQGKRLEIDIESDGAYKEMPSVCMITLEILGIARPASVKLDGQRLEAVSTPKAIRNAAWYYDAASRTLTVGFGYGYKPMQLTIN